MAKISVARHPNAAPIKCRGHIIAYLLTTSVSEGDIVSVPKTTRSFNYVVTGRKGKDIIVRIGSGDELSAKASVQAYKPDEKI